MYPSLLAVLLLYWSQYYVFYVHSVITDVSLLSMSVVANENLLKSHIIIVMRHIYYSAKV